MFRWLFFWRRKQLPKPDASKPEAEPSLETEPEPISMPQERRDDVSSRSKGTRTLMVVRSNTARAVEPQCVEDDSAAKPVLALPAGLHVISQPAETVETKPRQAEGSLTGKVDASDVPKSGRINYFTRGCYAVASLGRPRLIAPDVILDTRRGRPRTLPGQNGTADAVLNKAQLHPPAAEK